MTLVALKPQAQVQPQHAGTCSEQEVVIEKDSSTHPSNPTLMTEAS
ncbi:hypothetical protein FWK35_00032594 [Aphis craccivora]|uniref:Uncharacterized protein n=1 Tax=Aphis craccivora TaxID=307492 RepID=A0A6G0VU79_APHCR|nr:hypothetical protein FWK35_00032594 [Aphis craccivora]